MTKFYVADDCRSTFEFLTSLIATSPGWTLAGSATSLEQFTAGVGLVEPDVLIVSIAWLALIASEPTRPQGVILAVSDADEPDELRLALRLGAVDLITPGMARDELIALIERRLPPAGEDAALAALFTGAKGGTGTTFVACHVAGLLSRYAGKRVVLVDRARTAGAADILKTEDAMMRDAADLLPVLDELEEQHIRRVLRDTVAGFAVLRMTPERIGLAEAGHVLSVVRRCCDILMIDAACGDALETSLAGSADKRFMTTTLTEASLRATAALASSSAAGIALIVNRFDARFSVRSGDVAELVDLPVITEIPDDPGAAGRFETTGVPLVERTDLGVIQALLPVAQELAVFDAPPEPRRFGLDRLLKSVRREW